MDLLLFIFLQWIFATFQPELNDDPPVLSTYQLAQSVVWFIREQILHILSDWINVTMISWIPCENHFSNVIDRLVLLALRIFATRSPTFWLNDPTFVERCRIKTCPWFVQVVFPFVQCRSFYSFFGRTKTTRTRSIWIHFTRANDFTSYETPLIFMMSLSFTSKGALHSNVRACPNLSSQTSWLLVQTGARYHLTLPVVHVYVAFLFPLVSVA